MATYKDYFPGRFMAASDLEGELPVIIDRIEKETFEGDGKTKPVAFFRGHEKGLVLNKTNFKSIAEIAGEDDNNWCGVNLVLFTMMVPFRDKVIEAIRIRRPTAEPDANEPPPDDGVPNHDLP